jgi:pimeloyl-ACP methyl ester carboxylesterase
MARSTPEEITALAPLASLLRVERLPGVGHFPHEEVPDEVASFVLAAQVASAGRRMERAR